jgi:uncharacterized spore protein YtfJ
MSELIKSIIDPLHQSAAARSVYGEPVTAQGKTVIPVARIAYGFGGGSGKAHSSITPRIGEGQGEGEGGGGGGGVIAMPVGVFEVTDSGTRFVPANGDRKLLGAALAGIGLGLIWGRLRRR